MNSHGRFPPYDFESYLVPAKSDILSCFAETALHKDAFELHYQDIVSIANSQTVAREALLRWRDRDQPPPCTIAALLEAAENGGQIIELGSRILESACRDAAGWPDLSPVAVNVSPLQLLAGDFADRTFAILSETGLPPGRLVIEITETAALAATGDVIDQIARLRAAGIELALDDFGSGYSSLRNLQFLPFDKIKLDSCFIREALDDERSRKIIAAVVGLGRELGLDVVAEGIETYEQLDLVKSAGCDLIQGYLFSRPRPNPEVLTEALRKRAMRSSRGGPRTAAGRAVKSGEESIVIPVRFVADLAASVGQDEMLDAIVRWSGQLLSADRASIALRHDDAYLKIVSAHGVEPLLKGQLVSVEKTLIGRVFSAQWPEVCNDMARSADVDCQMLHRIGLVCCLDVPLVCGEHCYGTLNVARLSGVFEQHELERLQSLGKWLALQISMYSMSS